MDSGGYKKHGFYPETNPQDALRKAELVDWTIAKNSHEVIVLNGYIQKCNTGFYPTSHITEAKKLLEQWENGTIVTDWDKILAEPNMDARTVKINEFIQKYAMNTSETAQKYLDKAGKELARIADEKEARKDWIDATQKNEIIGYVQFISKHPYCDYREEADRRIQEMKGNLLTDMKRYPFKYTRDMMYEYINTNALTMADLVDNSDTLTDCAYSHIKRYPSLIDGQENLPIMSMDNIAYNSIKGNVDVLFFGVSGSGGKTCLMASLMSLVGESTDFMYQEYNDNKECNNTYGTYLADYMKSNRLPPATDSCYIQVVNTFIRCNNKYKGVSFIEFAGEQVAALAGNSAEEGISFEGIIPSLGEILNNNNKKIIFITLDPTNLKNIQICASAEDKGDLWVSQSDALSCVISHLKNNPKFMRNVIGFHSIISKSDTWLQGSLSSSIKQVIESSGAGMLFLQIDQLCKTYNLNGHPNGSAEPIPFSIGKFMVGDTYEFDNSDAHKILDIIKADLIITERNITLISKVRTKIKSDFNN